MKKKLLIIAGLLFLLVAGVMISAPLLIESQKVQEQVLNRLNSWYVVDASVEKITFTWFPFPHLDMEQLEVLHQNFSATSPQATLYPSWKVFFDFSSLGRLHFVDPVFQVHEAPEDDQGVRTFAISLPRLKVQIKNGTLILPAQQNTLFSSDQISLDNITASFAAHDRGGEFSWQSTASFASKIAFSGDFGPRGYGTLKGEIKDLEASKIAARQSTSLLATTADKNNLTFSASRDATGLQANLQGEIPDFSLSRLATTENFRIGKGDLSLRVGAKNSFSLVINDLIFLDPQVQLRGEIARYLPVEQEQENIKIDLKAQDIDLSAIRLKILSLLADSEVANLVCDIVKGGEANSASYHFDAPVKSFEDVTAMTIAVDIADSDIHLADIPLDLSHAQGPILIKDGDLTGQDITTWVGDAKGTDGVFLVGLADDKHGLLVDVDIDANLEELPGVLRTLLDDQDVVRELARVQGRGRANGHLHIGDNLTDFNVIVDVNRYDDAELRYDRLSWPLRPESGDLQVTGTSVTWQGIKAKLGSHSIQETSGQAAWQDPTVPMTINSFQGFFDANTLLGELRAYPVLAESFTGVVDSIHGSIEVTGSLAGPFFEPEQYTYRFDTRVKDITFATPALPEKVVIDKGQGTVSHQDVKIISSSGILFGRPIHLNGVLDHDDWQSWHGNLQLTGIVDKKHLDWLISKDVFPAVVPPRPPYRVDNMNIRWDDKLFNLSAQILSADETTSLGLEIEDQNDSFSALFRVTGPTDKASFVLQRHDGNDTWSSSFTGIISGTALQALLDDGNASFKGISGDFNVKKGQDSKSGKLTLDFSGDLVAQDIHWQWGKENRVVSIPTLQVVGEDSQLKIKELKTSFNNEVLQATGTFVAKPGAGHFELDLTSPPSLTTTNIENFQDDLDHFLYTTLALNKEAAIFPVYDITGFLNFNLDSLVMPFGRATKHGATGHLYRLPFTPLKGNYLFNKDDSTLNLHNSEVCGVQVNGQLSWQGAQETRKEISMLTPAHAPLEFEKFLSCFNFDRVIEGPLNISGRIYSDTKLCKRGGLLLSSQKGTIKRFVALAKTLSLVNITGLSGSIWKEGFYYNALELSGNICDNIFTIDKAFIDGDGVDVVATGDINLSTMEYDLTFFVVPFATVNSLVTRVPLVGRVLGGQQGRIVSVPVKVTGPLDDPIVAVLSPSAIGEATGQWILDTITLPFGWITPPQKSDQGEEQLAD